MSRETLEEGRKVLKSRAIQVNGGMAAWSAVMLRSLWFLTCILAVKKQTFVTEINLNFNLDLTYHENITPNETFIYSSLWITMKNKTFKGNSISLLMLLLLSGDIHPCPGPITIQEINNFCKSRGLKCFQQKIRGLQGKYDEVKNILIHYKKVDIFSLSEIFINDDTVILSKTLKFRGTS